MGKEWEIFSVTWQIIRLYSVFHGSASVPCQILLDCIILNNYYYFTINA